MSERNKTPKAKQKNVAIFVLAVLLLNYFSPIGIMLTPTVSAQTRSTGNSSGLDTFGSSSFFSAGKSGLLSGLLSGGKGSMMLGLLMTLLTQLFKGGGSTPQTGNAEENYPYLPTASERFYTGTQNSSGTGNSTDGAGTVISKGVYLIKDANGVNLYPKTTSIYKGESITVFSSDTNAQTIQIKKNNQVVTQKEVPAGGAYIFQFSNSGIYQLCQTAACTTVTVN
jgi:hypothetical protein